MDYRPLGRTGIDVAAVSLGTEYLINLPVEHVAGVIDAAIDQGINYFDLFYAQAGFRDLMGAVFRGKRQKAMLAAHLGGMEVDGQHGRTREPAVAQRYFLDFLTRYHTDYVDVLFLHNINDQADYDEAMAEPFLGLARRAKQEGKARLIGFSGHSVSTSMQAVQSGVVDVLMYPINLAGHAVEGRRELLQACADRGVGLVAMKPFAGGRLLRPDAMLGMGGFQVGSDAEEVVKQRPAEITPTQCLAYALAQPGVSAVLPGCKDRHELAAALAVLDAGDGERDFSGVLAHFADYREGECVYCNHCLPCPSGIDVGGTQRLLDESERGMNAALRAAYAALPVPASACSECGSCADLCPFGVDAPARVAEAARCFEGI
ncbi:MAG: aldo/keto reductase [Anaerolineae bacterium]